jgi:hypothetical protein
MDMVRILRWVTSQGHANTTRRPVLVIDATTAHIAVAPELADGLFAWFRGQGIECELWPGGTVPGMERIDFGNPSPGQERQIRKAFAAWEKRN